MHSHLCGVCNTSWQHPDSCGGSEIDHKCPKCGKMQWNKNYSIGSIKVNFVFVSPSKYLPKQVRILDYVSSI
jgi:hypothetical protein